MKGTRVLVIALGAVSKTFEPLQAAQFIAAHRPIRDLEALEMTILKHLAAVEDLLAHVRRMQIAHAPAGCSCTPGTVYALCPVHGRAAA